MSMNYSNSPLPQPSQAESNYADQKILDLQQVSIQNKCAASAQLWVHQVDKDPLSYEGNSNPDLTICAEQACMNQLKGIFPKLQKGQYSQLFLYHIKGDPPCGRCQGQFVQLSSMAQHPIRVWWGRTNSKSQQLPLKFTDFVNGEAYTS